MLRESRGSKWPLVEPAAAVRVRTVGKETETRHLQMGADPSNARMTRRDELKIGLQAGTATQNTTGRGDKPLDESALLRRIVERDRMAFEELYHAYYRRLFGYLFRILRRVDTVEEILNDVMMAVWRQAAQFRGDSRISTWIFGIAYRQAMKSIRRTKSQPLLFEPEDRLLRVESKDAEDDAIERELRLTLNAALERLSPQHRAVVELTYYYGYSYSEIAKIVDCPENTVKTRMFHARRKLRKLAPELAGMAGTT